MKNACENWKEPLREAALTGTTAKDLEEHLRSCANCSAELDEVRARAARLDALLPLVAQGAEPSADFRARVLAAVAAKEGKRGRPWRVWTLAGATVVLVTLLAGGLTSPRTNGPAIPERAPSTTPTLAPCRPP